MDTFSDSDYNESDPKNRLDVFFLVTSPFKNTIRYTKALADRILSSVQRSTILRVKPGLQVRIFYLFKMSSKMLISRVYIYIYTRNRWYFELINYGNISPNLHGFKLKYSICWIRVYIYIWFSAFSMVYFIRWRINIKKSTISYQYIHQRREHH